MQFQLVLISSKLFKPVIFLFQVCCVNKYFLHKDDIVLEKWEKSNKQAIFHVKHKMLIRNVEHLI